MLGYHASGLVTMTRKNGLYMGTGLRQLLVPTHSEDLERSGTTKKAKASLMTTGAVWEVGKVFSPKKKLFKSVQFVVSGTYEFAFLGTAKGTVDNVTTIYKVSSAHLGLLNLQMRFTQKSKKKMSIAVSPYYGTYTLTKEGGKSTPRSYTGVALSFGLWLGKK